MKTFHKNLFAALGLATDFCEQYYSVSSCRVLRGMHFQKEPHAHSKLVTCISGSVLDVVVELETGRVASFSLSDENRHLLYIPPGFAHGFYTLSSHATMLYNVTSVYSKESDCGVLWSSFGFDWPDKEPILSERDRSFSPLF